MSEGVCSALPALLGFIKNLGVHVLSVPCEAIVLDGADLEPITTCCETQGQMASWDVSFRCYGQSELHFSNVDISLKQRENMNRSVSVIMIL